MTGENRGPSGRAADSVVESIAETGRVAAEIAKGAARGGWHGVAAAAAKTSKKWLAPVVLMFAASVLLVAMLPSVIFGPLLSDGSERVSGIADGAALTENMAELDRTLRNALTEGHGETLEAIERDFAASGCDTYEVIDPYASEIRFNASWFISLYCAARDSDPVSISKEDLEAIIRESRSKLYSFTCSDEVRIVAAENGEEEADEPETRTVTVRVYKVVYNGEAYFADEIFHLDEAHMDLARGYAQNLSALLRDGSWQVLSATEFSGFSGSYDGVAFTDGQIPVVYFCQGDERWKDLPYGTDTIGGYACGPTAMSIVVSSLTPYVVDPPAMSRWAYENGHWCSGNGSYQSVITGACEKWGLNVETCARDETARIKSALRSGKLIVAVMGPGHFTKSGHFIVLRGITAAGKILVADPASYRRSGQEWDLEIITDEASSYELLTAPFWIVGN